MTANSSGGGEGQVMLATGSYDHTIKLWHLTTGACLRTLQHSDSQVNAMAFTPDKLMLVAAGHQHIRRYDINSAGPNPTVNFEGISKNVNAVGFQAEGKWMYTGGEDTYARIWDLRSRSLQCQRIFQVNSAINCVCLHPNQCELFVGDQSGIIHLWDIRTEHNEQLIPECDASIQSLCVDDGGTMMAAVNNKGNCYIWSLTSVNSGPTVLEPQHKIQAHRRYALKCSVSPDAKLLVTTSADQTARVWDTTDFSLARELKNDAQRWVWDAAFSNDSKYLITGSSDGVARFWNLQSGSMEREYSGHQKAITAIAFSDTP